MWKRISLIALAMAALAACQDAPLGAPAGPAGPALSASSAEQGPVIEVKFREEEGVRAGADGRLRSARGRSVAALQAALDRAGVREARGLFAALPAGRLEALEQAARARSREPIPDLRSWHRLSLPPGADVERVLAALRALSQVEHANPAPRPAPPPATPDYTWRQTYYDPAPQGSDMDYMHTLPGGKGAGVTVVDMESGWDFSHEDLPIGFWQLISGNMAGDLPEPDTTALPGTGYYTNHGTAVVGQLVARDNGIGVTGGVPNANLRLATPTFLIFYLPAVGIANVAAQLYPGDVLLLEMQWSDQWNTLLPLEWDPAVYDAIRLATQAGIVVVEAGANGGRNLDDPVFGGRFNRTLFDSGAILVGAGDVARARLSFSSYGSRVDVQGLGKGITTTGYGDLHGFLPGNTYTATFGGTSGASPIVASAAVSIQGYLKATGRPVLTPAQMRTLLVSTGTPQTGTGKIGPYPNLRAAVTQLDQQFPIPPAP